MAVGFGALLRRYRLAAGLSQEALAERARLSIYGISALERGYRRAPQRETLEMLADALALTDEQRRAFEREASRASVRRRREELSVAVRPWPSPTSADLPLALTRFVGRENELDEIAALLREHRFVTITGAGGIGKTQTALRTAIAVSEADDTGLCFVNLAPVGDPALVATAIASAVGVQEVPNHPLVETLHAFLKNACGLMLLDNCEHVIGVVATVADSLLRACPELRILATSREPLRAGGEHAYRLPSLDHSDAGTLFAERARAADSHFIVTIENRAAVVEICRRLSGIPLAIELAAAQVSTFSMQSLASTLDDRFGVLTRGERTAPPRQQTMRAAIDWSYELLTEPERRLFERFSIFAGGCTMDVARTVCQGDDVNATDVVSLISSLVSKSMLVAEIAQSEPRFRMLEPFREYAREKLALRGEHDAVAHRHAHAYLHLAERLDVTWDSMPDREWLQSARAEMENWRQALEFSLTGGSEVALGQRLVAALLHEWPLLGLIVEGRRWCALARGFVSDHTPAAVAAGLSCVDFLIANHLEEYEREVAASSDALEIYRSLGDELGIALAEPHRVRGLVLLGRTAGLEEAIMAALDRARRLGRRKGLSYALRIASAVSVRDGDLAKARAQLSEAEAVAKACGAEWELVQGSRDRAECEFLAGNIELAVEYASVSLHYARAIDSVLLTASCLVENSRYLSSLASYEPADDCAGEALVIAKSLGAENIVLLSLQQLALISAARQQSPADRESAARILGFLRARISTVGAAIGFKEEYDRALAHLKLTMDTDALEKLLSEGARLTEELVIDLALNRP